MNLKISKRVFKLVGWFCFTSHQQQGHSETAPPFTVPCEGREARFLHRSYQESNPRTSRGSSLHYRCVTPAPRVFRRKSVKPYHNVHCCITVSHGNSLLHLVWTKKSVVGDFYGGIKVFWNIYISLWSLRGAFLWWSLVWPGREANSQPTV